MKFYILIAFLFFSFSSHATTVSWVGGGDGISWHDPDNWSGSNVPDFDDDVSIASDSVVISTAAEANGIEVQTQLTILSTGSLVLDDGNLNAAFGYYALIVNFGNISILNGGVIVGSLSEIINESGAEMTMNGGINGLSSYGEFLNKVNGEVYISNALAYGLRVDSLLENMGFIQIIDSEIGLGLPGTSIHANLKNSGRIEVKNSNSHGVFVTIGTLTNENEILTSNNGGNGFYNFGTNSAIYNKPGGKIKSKDGILNNGFFENKGLVYAENPDAFALENVGEFLNKDTLFVSCLNNTGLLNNGDFTNNPAGVILNDSINANQPNEFYFLQNEGLLENKGILKSDLNSVLNGIKNEQGADLHNFGELNIKNALVHGINSLDSITNYNGALIRLVGAGLGIINQKVFTNPGEVRIQDSPSGNGISQFAHSAIFENMGLLTIDNLEGDFAIKNAGGHFVNKFSGTVEVLDVNLAEASILNSSSIVNKGSLYINVTSQTPALHNLTSTSSFVNKGSVKFQTTHTAFVGIQNYGELVNDTCATLVNYHKVRNEIGSSWKNVGYFEHFGIGDFENFGVLENSGFYNSHGKIRKGLYPNSAKGVSINSFYHPLGENITSAPVLSKALNSNFLIDSTWYSDEALSISSARFDSIKNLVTVNSNLPSPNVYFRIRWPEVTCEKVIRVKVQTSPPKCDSYQLLEFQNDDNEGWFGRSNWSTKTYPDYCSNILVPAGQTLNLPVGFLGAANKIEIQSGAVFEAELGSILDARNGF